MKKRDILPLEVTTLRVLEISRQQAMYTSLLTGLTFLGFLASLYFAYMKSELDFNTTPYYLAGVALIIWLIVRSINQNFHRKYRIAFTLLKKNFVLETYLETAYEPDMRIGDEFETACLFSGHNSIVGSNYISRKIGETTISGSNLGLYNYYTVTVSDSNGTHQETRCQTIFNGIMIKIHNWPLPFTGRVFVEAGKINLRKGFQKVTIAAIEMRKGYTVQTSDGFLAQKVMSPATIDMLLNLNQFFDRNCSYSYLDGTLFIAVPNLCWETGEPPWLYWPITQNKLQKTLHKLEAMVRSYEYTCNTLCTNISRY